MAMNNVINMEKGAILQIVRIADIYCMLHTNE